MEKNLNEQQTRLQELLETKSFEQLSTEEKEFVLKLLTKDAYELRRQVLVVSADVYEEGEPLPLVLPVANKGVVIPLYQAVAGIAAAILLSFFLFRGETIYKEINEGVLVAEVDTVFVDKNIYNTDTVVEYRREYVDRIIERTVSSPVATVKEKNVPVFVGGAPQIPTLSSMDLGTKGTPAANDETLSLVGDYFQ